MDCLVIMNRVMYVVWILKKRISIGIIDICPRIYQLIYVEFAHHPFEFFSSIPIHRQAMTLTYILAFSVNRLPVVLVAIPVDIDFHVHPIAHDPMGQV